MKIKILTLFLLIPFIVGIGGLALGQGEAMPDAKAVAPVQVAANQAAAATEKSYNLGLVYRNGRLSPKEIVLEDFAPRDHRVWPQDGWLCQMLAVDGAVIDAFNFSLPVVECRDQAGAQGGLEGGCAAGDAADFNLSVPYYANGAAVAVFDPDGNLAFTADTVKFADLCGDDVCEQNENYLTCAKDCRSGVRDGACDKVGDGTCDADCAGREDADCSIWPKLAAGYIWLVVLAAISVAIIIGFVIWRRKRSI